MKASIIVPTYNRKEDLERCIDHLEQLDYPEEEHEIIVINDGSTDGTEELLEQKENKITNFTGINKENGGAGSARNKGIEAASGDYIFFIDDDCLAPEDWIQQHMEHYKENEDIAGVDGVQWPHDKNWIEAYKIAREWREFIEETILGPEHRNTIRSVTTNNLSYKKEVFEEAGDFDEDIMRGQDTEHGHRVLKAGFLVLKDPDIRVSHLKKDSLRSLLETRYKLGKNLHRQEDKGHDLENPNRNLDYLMKAWKTYIQNTNILLAPAFPVLAVSSIAARKLGERNAETGNTGV